MKMTEMGEIPKNRLCLGNDQNKNRIERARTVLTKITDKGRSVMHYKSIKVSS